MNSEMPEWNKKIALTSTFHHLQHAILLLNIQKLFPVMPTVLIIKAIGIKDVRKMLR